MGHYGPLWATMGGAAVCRVLPAVPPLNLHLTTVHCTGHLTAVQVEQGEVEVHRSPVVGTVVASSTFGRLMAAGSLGMAADRRAVTAPGIALSGGNRTETGE